MFGWTIKMQVCWAFCRRNLSLQTGVWNCRWYSSISNVLPESNFKNLLWNFIRLRSRWLFKWVRNDQNQIFIMKPASWSSDNALVYGTGDLRFKSRAVQIGHRGAKGSTPQRYFFERSYVARRRNDARGDGLRQLVTCFGVIQQVQWKILFENYWWWCMLSIPKNLVAAKIMTTLKLSSLNPICRQHSRKYKVYSFLRQPWLHDFGSSYILVTLLCPFTMIISAWLPQKSSKFSWEEVKRQSESLQNNELQNGWKRTVQKKSPPVAFSWAQ